jgi:8-oxo-dGTP pyrophosphatase MutT (NUDIX family)
MSPATRWRRLPRSLRETPVGPDLLFIRRAEHPNDPWSEDTARVGGRVDPGDGSPLATAVRETREELTLGLEREGTLLGLLRTPDPTR